MRKLILRILLTALGLWIADTALPGVRFADVRGLGTAALILGLANSIIRPILYFISFPITILTLGLSRLVISAALVLVVARTVPAFHVEGFLPAVLVAVAVGAVNWLLEDPKREKRKERE